MSRDLGGLAVRGAVWLGSGQMLRMLIGFGTTAALARILSPDDFGVFGMTYVAAELAQIIAAFGFGSAIVQKQVNEPDILSTCFWINLGLGLLAGLVLLAMGPAVGSYFKRPEVANLMWPLALLMVVTAGMVVPQALLTQRMQFSAMMIAQTVGSVGGAVVTIALALLGFGFWALAVQPLAGNLLTSAVMFWYANWWPTWRLRVADIRDMLNFSVNLLARNLTGFFGRNMPSLVIGRLLDATALAIYALASHITGAVLFQISSVIVRVLFPTLSAMKGDSARLQAAWFRCCSVIAIIAFPLMAGTAALAADVVMLLLGPQWAASAMPLRILGIAMAMQAVLTTSGTVLMALGRADTLFHMSIFSVLASIVGLWIGAAGGVDGAVLGYALASGATMLLQTLFACRQASIPALAMLRELTPWAVAATVTGLCMWMASLAASDWYWLIRLAVLAVLGALVYIGTLMIVARTRTLDLLTDLYARLRPRAA